MTSGRYSGAKELSDEFGIRALYTLYNADETS